MNTLRPVHAILLTTISLVGILTLWLERLSGGSFDQTLVINHSSPLVDGAMVISALTSPTTVLAVVILSGAFAAYEHHAKIWWLLSCLLLIALAISTLLKQLFALPRPEDGLINLTSYGFPSTHAALATILFILGTWFFVWLKKRVSTTIILFTGLGWAAVCLSRLVLGVHSVSDILAGILVGLAISVIAVSHAPKIFHYFRIKRSGFINN